MKKITAIVFALLIGFGCTANASCPKFKDHKKGDEIAPLYIAMSNGEKTVKIKGTKYKIVLSKKNKKLITSESDESITTDAYKSLEKDQRKLVNLHIAQGLKELGVKITHLKSKKDKHSYKIKCQGERETIEFSLKEKK